MFAPFCCDKRPCSWYIFEFFLTLSRRKKFGSISDIQNFREENNFVTSPSALSSMESKLPSENNLVHDSTRRHSTVVADVRIPIQKNLANSEGKRFNCVLVKFPDINDGAQRLLQTQPGQPGSFFSVVSTNQQPVSCTYELSQRQTKCHRCCMFSVASIRERWSPYKPGTHILS